ncbi:MAG: MFS transporter [Puniceicoccaceae bacterium]
MAGSRGPVMWVLLGEMFPDRFRCAALSFAGLTRCRSNVTVTMAAIQKNPGRCNGFGFR